LPSATAPLTDAVSDVRHLLQIASPMACFRIEEFVDVGFGKADRLGQIRYGRLAIAIVAEMRMRGIDDLVADAVIGGAALSDGVAG
jgi:hypothetical protein